MPKQPRSPATPPTARKRAASSKPSHSPLLPPGSGPLILPNAINMDADEAERLLTAGQCSAAAKRLTRTIAVHRHSPSRALKAWLLLHGRVGVPRDCNRAFALVEKGTRLGCHHCQGVMAFCYGAGVGCETDRVRSLELARESAGRGSRYGQFTLGKLHFHGQEELPVTRAQRLHFFA